MKKKLFGMLLAICMLLPCILLLNACNGGGDNSADYLNFTLLEDGTYSVALKDEYRVVKQPDSVAILDGEKKFDLKGKTVKIPATYEDKAVTQVADYAFYNSQVTAVEIPEGVTYIGIEAFFGSASLKSVSLPDTVKIICPQAFDNLTTSDYGGKADDYINHIIVPTSLEYVGDYSFDTGLKLYYKGTAEQFAEIKTVSRTENDLMYSDTPFFPDEQKWFFYAENVSDITDFISEDKKIKGVWNYNDAQKIQSIAIEYTDTVNGKSYTYTNSVVTVTDELWDMLSTAKAQGMLETLLTPDEVELFNASRGKEDYAAKCQAYNATQLAGMTVKFADGALTLWKGEEQYSYPALYLEVNNAIYYKQGYNYTLLYTLDGNKLAENASTEYGGATHYYEQAN